MDFVYPILGNICDCAEIFRRLKTLLFLDLYLMGAFNKVHDKTTQFLIHTHRFLSIICILFIGLQFWNEKNTTWDFQLCNRVSVDTVLWIPEETFPNNQHWDRLLFRFAKIRSILLTLLVNWVDLKIWFEYASND